MVASRSSYFRIPVTTTCSTYGAACVAAGSGTLAALAWVIPKLNAAAARTKSRRRCNLLSLVMIYFLENITARKKAARENKGGENTRRLTVIHCRRQADCIANSC